MRRACSRGLVDSDAHAVAAQRTDRQAHTHTHIHTDAEPPVLIALWGRADMAQTAGWAHQPSPEVPGYNRVLLRLLSESVRFFDKSLQIHDRRGCKCERHNAFCARLSDGKGNEDVYNEVSKCC